MKTVGVDVVKVYMCLSGFDFCCASKDPTMRHRA